MGTDAGRSHALGWTIERQRGLTTVTLSGELDMASAEDFGAELQRLFDEGSVLVVDLAGLDFMDSTGLRLFGKMKLQSDKDGTRFLLGRISAPVRRVLHVSGLTEHFDYVEGGPASEVLCRTCDTWVAADQTRCMHCGAKL